MASRAAGQLFSGLLVGAAIGATAAIVLASRTELAAPGQGTRHPTGPTPFAPANEAIRRAQHFMRAVRTQVKLAVEEGKKTAAETRADLNKRFDEAKHSHRD
jgi:hypothetical protein